MHRPFGQRGLDAYAIKPVVAEFRTTHRLPREKYWNAIAVLRFERGVRIDIDDRDGQMTRVGQRLHRFEHLVAEMAIGSRKQRQLQAGYSPLLILSVAKNSCSPRRKRNVTDAPLSIFVRSPLT